MIDHISYSYLHLLACPYAAFLRYDRHMRSKRTVWLVNGDAVHTALEHTHRDGEWDLNTAVNTYSTEFARMVEEEEVFVNYPTMRKLESESTEMLAIYDLKIRSGEISAHPLDVEKEFRIPVAGTEIVGFIDRVDYIDGYGFVITDYKTGKKKPDPWFLNHNLQGTTYWWACKEIYGEYPREFVWNQLRTGDLLRTTRTPGDIANLKKMVENAVRMNEMGIRHRVYHEAVCDYCDFEGAVCDENLEDVT